MKQSVAMSVMRGLINGGKCSNRYVRMVVGWNPNAWDGNDMSLGVMYWRRMMVMRTYSSSEKESKGEEKGVIVSSYWGISRPKITREDGTEWPWNCFMVSSSP